jgi:hydroxymethylbilane synthase
VHTAPTHAPDRDALRIGTRRSALALYQARTVQDALAALGVASTLVTFDTVGDLVLDRALSAVGGKGLFTAELEAALRGGGVDLCVHSLKDLPTALDPDIGALAVLAREDPRDVLVGPRGRPVPALSALRAGARVGTCALRRRAQLAERRPDLAVLDLRGNVPTRLAKLDAGGYDAVVLAAAGLLRLGLAERVDGWLDAPAWLPAPGQGAIAVQARAGDRRTDALLAALHHAPTGMAVAAERAFLRALDGGCSVPIGALTLRAAAGPVLHGLVAEVGGGRSLRDSEFVDPRAPEAAGEALARRLRTRGADAILAAVRADAPAAVGAAA